MACCITWIPAAAEITAFAPASSTFPIPRSRSSTSRRCRRWRSRRWCAASRRPSSPRIATRPTSGSAAGRSTEMSDRPLWAPSPGQIARANLTRFIDLVNQRHGLAISGYHPLWEWSVENLEDFWTDLWDFAGVIAQTRGKRALVDGDKMPGARFFPDAKLNFAENLLRRASGTNHEDGDAIIFWGEDKVRRRLRHRELRD